MFKGVREWLGRGVFVSRFFTCLVLVGFMGVRMLLAEGWTLIPAGAPFYTPDTELGLGIYAVLCSDPKEESNPGPGKEAGIDPLEKKKHEGGIKLKGKPNELVLFFTGTQNLQMSLGLQPEWYAVGDRYRISGYAELGHYPGWFWGIGPDSKKERAELYEPSYLVWKASIYRRIQSALYAGPRLSFRYSEIDAGPLVGSVPGGDGGKLLGFGFGGVWDSRDSSFYPTKGILVEGFLEFHKRFWGSDWDYGVGQLDIRGYLRMGENGVLALQGRAQIAWGTVPFLSYPSLGGSTLMRGYSLNRFQDLTSLAIQGEYRFPLLGRFGGVLFIGAGDVAPSIGEYFAGSTPKIVGGGGLRFQLDSQRKISARLDAGFTSEGVGVYLLVKEAF